MLSLGRSGPRFVWVFWWLGWLLSGWVGYELVSVKGERYKLNRRRNVPKNKTAETRLWRMTVGLVAGEEKSCHAFMMHIKNG